MLSAFATFSLVQFLDENLAKLEQVLVYLQEFFRFSRCIPVEYTSSANDIVSWGPEDARHVFRQLLRVVYICHPLPMAEVVHLLKEQSIIYKVWMAQMLSSFILTCGCIFGF
jgi:hypothetical protein